jgi:hypothetical protein
LATAFFLSFDQTILLSPYRQTLSGSLATHPLFRCRERPATHLPDQQFSSLRFDHRPTVLGSPACGIVLPPDQIRQRLRIETFYGTSGNAVKTQVWVAVSVYVLAAIVKKQLALELSRYKSLQILERSHF